MQDGANTRTAHHVFYKVLPTVKVKNLHILILILCFCTLIFINFPINVQKFQIDTVFPIWRCIGESVSHVQVQRPIGPGLPAPELGGNIHDWRIKDLGHCHHHGGYWAIPTCALCHRGNWLKPLSLALHFALCFI